MPFKREKYPENWLDVIRPAILKREGYKCKLCNAPHKGYIVRQEGITFYEIGKSELAIEKALGCKVIRIILSVAHCNHDTTDNRDNNLMALCQKCHLNYDRTVNNIKRKAVFWEKRNVGKFKY